MKTNRKKKSVPNKMFVNPWENFGKKRFVIKEKETHL